MVKKPSHATVLLKGKYSMHNENLSCILFWYSLMTSWPVHKVAGLLWRHPLHLSPMFMYSFLWQTATKKGGGGDEAEPFLATKKNMSKRPDSLI